MLNESSLQQTQPITYGLRVKEAVKQINVSKRFLELAIEQGLLPVIRLGPRCVRVRPQDLSEYLQRFLTVGPAKNVPSMFQSKKQRQERVAAKRFPRPLWTLVLPNARAPVLGKTPAWYVDLMLPTRDHYYRTLQNASTRIWPS